MKNKKLNRLKVFRAGVLALAASNLTGLLLLLLRLAAEAMELNSVAWLAWNGLTLVFLVSGFASVLLVLAPLSMPNRSLLMASLFFVVVATAGHASAHNYFVGAVCFSLFLLQISLWLEDESLRFSTYLWTLAGMLAAAFIHGLLYWIFVTPILWRIYKGTADRVGNAEPDESSSD